MSELYVKSYLGIGDNIYQRPFIKKLAEKHDTIYLDTPIPQIYVDCGKNIRYVRPSDSLRTQNKISDELPEVLWTEVPHGTPRIKMGYHFVNTAGKCHQKGDSVIECFDAQVPGADLPRDFKLDVREAWIKEAEDTLSEIGYKSRKQMCIIRPCTVRKEWEVPNRNCKPEYIQLLIDNYKDKYTFISIADLEEGLEWTDGQLQGIDHTCHKGEFSWNAIMGLFKIADMVITPVGFALPLAAAVDVKCFVIFGGYMEPEIVLDRRMGLENMAWVTPDPMCECRDPKHECNLEIDPDYILRNFEMLRNSELQTSNRKKNLLLVRFTPELAEQISDNKYLQEEYNLIALDQADIKGYKDFKDRFTSIYQISGGEKQVKDIIQQDNIDIAIIQQKLFHLSDMVAEVCRKMHIPVVWTERFFDGKMVFDRTGLHYTPENEIYSFVDTIKAEPFGYIEYPISTRQPQEEVISKKDVFDKYGLNKEDKHIVIMGQTTFDMSLKHSINGRVKTWNDYIKMLLEANEDVVFLIKHHPQYYTSHEYRRKEDIGWLDDTRVIEVRENIQTLFRAFKYFTSFSSTTVFEGILKGKIFATCGHHYCNDKGLVIQLRTTEVATNLYERISSFKINTEKVHRYSMFVCNYYALDLKGEHLVQKLNLPADEFYKYMEGAFE